MAHPNHQAVTGEQPPKPLLCTCAQPIVAAAGAAAAACRACGLPIPLRLNKEGWC